MSEKEAYPNVLRPGKLTDKWLRRLAKKDCNINVIGYRVGLVTTHHYNLIYFPIALPSIYTFDSAI